MKYLKIVATGLLILSMSSACAPMAGGGMVMDWRRSFEQRKSQEIERLLQSVVGANAARVQLSAEFNDKGKVMVLSVAVLVDHKR